MRDSRIVLIVLVSLLAATAASAADGSVEVELTAADLTPSSSNGSTWGWWNPGKFDDWRPDESSELALADVRLLFGGATYTVILGGEWMPELTGVGSLVDPDGGETVTESLSLDISAYDLALGQSLRLGRSGRVMPWLGATYVRISEQRTAVPEPGAGADAESGDARTSMWGASVGADLLLPVSSKLELAGRALFRWAKGTRDATLVTQPPGGGSSGTAELSDSVDRVMWRADLGLRWTISPSAALEGGWTMRDWTLDDGPASTSGPFLRAVLSF